MPINTYQEQARSVSINFGRDVLDASNQSKLVVTRGAKGKASQGRIDTDRVAKIDKLFTDLSSPSLVKKPNSLRKTRKV